MKGILYYTNCIDMKLNKIYNIDNIKNT